MKVCDTIAAPNVFLRAGMLLDTCQQARSAK